MSRFSFRFAMPAVIVSAAAEAVSAAPRVAIVRDPEPTAEREAFENQLRSELAAAGFEVVTVRESADSPEALETIASREGSVAAIRLDRPAGSVSARLWVTERVTGKTLLRTVRPEAVSPEAPGIIALRAVELLRASLLELNEAHPPRGSVPAPASVRSWVAPAAPAPAARRPAGKEPASWSIYIGPTLLGSPGGIPASFAPSVAFGWRPAPHWSSELRWGGPFVATPSTSSGSATIDQQFLTWRVRFDFLDPKALVGPFAVAGLGGHHMSVYGSASEPYRGRSASGYGLLAMAGGGARVAVTAALFLTAECAVAIAARRSVIRFADTDPITTGRPWVLTSLGVEYEW